MTEDFLMYPKWFLMMLLDKITLIKHVNFSFYNSLFCEKN